MKEATILGLKFTDSKHFIKNNKEAIKDHLDFLPPRTALVEYTVDAFNQDEGLHLALLGVKEKLNRISFLIRKPLNLNYSGYLGLIDEDETFFFKNSIYPLVSIYEYELNVIKKRENLIAKEEFNNFITEGEKLLAEAYSSIDLNTSMHNYSKFLEFFSKQSLTGVNNSEKYRIANKTLAIPYILLLTDKKTHSDGIQSWAHTVVYNSQFSAPPGVKLTKEQYQKMRSSRKMLSLTNMKQTFKHPHTQYRVNSAFKLSGRYSELQAFHYYVRILNKVIRYRNIEEHMNESESVIARKLKKAVQEICVNALRALINELNKPSNAILKPEEVLNAMILRGQIKFHGLNSKI